MQLKGISTFLGLVRTSPNCSLIPMESILYQIWEALLAPALEVRLLTLHVLKKIEEIKLPALAAINTN